MKEDREINNFEDLVSFLEEEKTQQEAIFSLLQEMLGNAKDSLLITPSKEAFIRIVYGLDKKAQIPAEVIRFLSLKISPFFSADKIDTFEKKFALLFQNQSIRENFIGDWLNELCDENKDGSMFISREMDAEIEHLQDTWEEQILQEEKQQGWKKLFKQNISQISLSIKEIYEYLAKKDPQEEKTIPQKSAFVEISKKVGNFLVSQGKTGYRYLKAHSFFWPQIQGTAKKAAQYSQKTYHWVLYEQEIYVWQNPPPGKQGYSAILQRKKSKICFSSLHKKHIQKLYECAIQDFSRVLKGIANADKLTREERHPFNLLKDCLSIQEKSLEQNETILDIINYGFAKFQSIVHTMSQLTNHKKLNDRIRCYLFQLAEKPLLVYDEFFRKQIEQSLTYNQIKKIMDQYPLYRTSVVMRYQPLKIILTLKQILEDFEQTPGELDHILFKYFGETGEVYLQKRLPEILVNSSINEKIWEQIAHENYLDEMLPKLNKLRQMPEYRKIAGSLYKLISVFIRGEGDFNFSHFKISLNFIPGKIQNKILYLVQQQLQEELNASVNTILAKRGKYVKRLYQLRKHFVDHRYRDSKITLFGYSPYEIEKKISSIEYQEGKMPKILYHAFNNGKAPEAFLRLIAKAKKAEKAEQEKNIPNTIRMLQKIQNAISHREDVDLYKVLIALFKINGSLNFASNAHDPVIHGYQIADEINRFYLTPNRTQIALSNSIIPEIKNAVESLINQEREKQLNKISKERE
ncbi:MAG: hypothetical protein HUU50_04820 [Candidatus Brocadiae bacterium]|nr:hypothetical protein [Candidatus Brocadiia bacterium]